MARPLIGVRRDRGSRYLLLTILAFAVTVMAVRVYLLPDRLERLLIRVVLLILDQRGRLAARDPIPAADPIAAMDLIDTR
jgi:hypothetical protein